MTIYKDLANNYYLGDLTYNNATGHLNSNVDVSNFYNFLESFLIKSGLQVEYVQDKQYLVSSLNTDSGSVSVGLFAFSAKDDPFFNRIYIYYGVNNNPALSIYSDAGHAALNYSGFSNVNRLATLGTFMSSSGGLTNITRLTGNLSQTDNHIILTSTSNSLSYIISQPRTSTESLGQNHYIWHYAGLLKNHNSAILNDINRRYVMLTSSFITSGSVLPTATGFSVIATETTSQYLVCGMVDALTGSLRTDLQTEYPYDESTPWATNFIIRNASNTILGEVENVKIANGIFTPLKPIKLSNYSEPGNNTWLPVGNIGSKTLLVRSYSSELFDENVTIVPLVDILNPEFVSLDMSSYYSF